MSGRMSAAQQSTRTPRARRALHRATGFVVAVAIYLVMVGSFGAWALAQGVLFAALAGVLSGGLAAPHAGRGGSGPRLLRQLPDLLVRQVLLGSWRVARVAAGLRPIPRGGRVTVPLRAALDAETIALALLETLSPGTYLLDVDAERRQLVFHVFDLDEREDLQRRQARLLHGEEAGAPRPGGDA